MNTNIPGDRAAIFAKAIIVLALWSATTEGLARPRPPLPPFPEFAGPVLFHEDFDWAYSVGLTNDEVVIANYGTLRESWTGMALQRSGPVTPFIVPALASTGHTNVASHTESAVRFWLTPCWASPAVGGAGPGKEATLLELFATDGQDAASLWSLRTTPDGSGLMLIARGDAGPVELLRADIAWTPSAHCLALNFGPEGTALFVDGALAAKGPGTLAVPLNLAGLVFGSTWTGSASAEGDLDEIHVFGRPLSEPAMAWHYATHAGQAALGPVSEAEWQAQREAAAKRRAEREAAGEGGGAQMLRLLDGVSECVTNQPLYITNVFYTNIVEQGPTVRFEVQGTNGPADIFTTTNLTGDSITSSLWTWLERGPTCSIYQYTNQPGTFAFYVLGTMLDSNNDGLTDACETLVLKTSPTNANSPRAIYEGVISNQNPSAWFKLNDGSLTNSVTSGQALTNLGGLWNPDAFAIGNSAYSFSTNLHKLVFTNDALGGGTGDATNQGSFTLLFKAMTRQATSKRYVLSQGTASSNAVAVYFDGPNTNDASLTGALRVGVGTNEQAILLDTNLVHGAWYYLAVTCYETNTSNAVRWYVGQVGSQTLHAGGFALGPAKMFGTTNAITLGNKDGSTNSAFRETPTINGSIDQVAFWRRELTETEVNDQFNALTILFQGPSKFFDLTRWELTLPVDETNQLDNTHMPLDISTAWLNSGFKYVDPADAKQKYFYLSNGSQMVFEAPWNGANQDTNSPATSLGSPRSELRGTLSNGNEDNWQPLGTNILEGTCTVNATNLGSGKVIIGQVHGKTPYSVASIVVNYNFPSSGDVSVTFKDRADGTDGPDNDQPPQSDRNVTLATGVALGATINYRIELVGTAGTSLTLHGTCNGGTTQTRTMYQNGDTNWNDSAWLTSYFYFKAGCYFPKAPTNSSAKVAFSSLTATH